ncbi:MAG: glycosyltransferase family 2 protein [Phycisphaerales bacterium]
MKYAVIIPVYNERELFPILLGRVMATPVPGGARRNVAADAPEPGVEAVRFERHVIVVDDGSTDGTREYVESLRARGTEGVHAFIQQRNCGKGAAVRSGFEAALALGVDVALIQDADLEYDPRDHAKLLEPMIDGRADAVFGSRFLGDTHRVLYYWHAVANRFITACSNTLTNLNLTDIECCLKAFSRPVMERLRIEENRFGVEPELVAKVAKMRLPRPVPMRAGEGARVPEAERGDGAAGRMSPTRPARVYEVGVSYAGRTYEEGKKITWRDGVSALRCIAQYGMRRPRL